MNLVLTVLEVVAPVFLLGAVGFTWVKLGFEYRLQFVTRLAADLATPCLIFTALMTSEIPPQALTEISVAAFAAYAVVSVVLFAVVHFTGLTRRTFLAPLIFGNTGNLGMPLALFAFGNQGLGYAVVVFAVSAVCTFTYGVWLVSGGGSWWRVLRQPLVVSTLLGALFLSQGWETPRFLTNALELIGQMAIPMMLITLGVAVARLKISRIGLPVALSITKFAVCASIGWAIASAFSLNETAFAVLVLQMATPVAVTSYLLAEKYDADSDAVAGLVVISTLISVLTLPGLLAIVI